MIVGIVIGVVGCVAVLAVLSGIGAAAASSGPVVTKPGPEKFSLTCRVCRATIEYRLSDAPHGVLRCPSCGVKGIVW